jgi:endonuclease G, mitochondrial
MRPFFCFVVLLSLLTGAVWAEERRMDYNGYTLWLDCDRKATIRFEYSLAKDTGDEKRKYYKKYRLDPSLGDCQQLSTKSYWKESNQTYQRGHLVSFNHLDYSPESATDANQMANILPQHKTLNQGAWKATEEITECFREFGVLRVTGGAIWDAEPRVLAVHRVDVPDYFWKVIQKENDAIGWIIPNDNTATADALDSFIVSLKDIEDQIGVHFNASYDRSGRPDQSWDVATCKGISGWQK